MENSKIEWTDATWNPVVGCARVSPGCDHCYAETLMRRYGRPELWQGARHRTSAENWRKPLAWNRKAERAGRRLRVFCASLSDVFDNQWEPQWRADMWGVIRATPHLDYQLLTKRPQNIARMLPEGWGDGWPNVWLGCTAENQEEADRRVPHLLGVPARVRFLSCEPLLGQLDILPWLPGDSGCVGCDDGEGWGTRCSRSDIPREEQCPRKLEVNDYPEGPPDADGVPSWIHEVKQTVDWVICGGESGPGRRPMDLQWARDLRDQCADAGVAFFMKQIDKVQPIPPDLMVRQFPDVRPEPT